MIGMLWRGGRRFVYFMIVVVLGYLCQVCVMPYLAVNGVTASMLFAVTAIVTVCYGKLRAFWVGAWYGIVMEIMLPSITFFNLLLYPCLLYTSCTGTWAGRAAARRIRRIRATQQAFLTGKNRDGGDRESG